MSRLLWWLITPRQLRRSGFIVLLAWLAVAFAYQDGTVPRHPAPVQLPSLVQDSGE